MTTLREAAQQALEALEDLRVWRMRQTVAIIALRSATAQQDEPAQETCTYKCEAWPECGCAPPEAEPVEPVATLTAQRDALLEALKEIVDAADGKGWEQLDPSFKMARAAIKKVQGDD